MAELSSVGEHLDYIFLLFIRVSGMLISGPIFGRKNVPNIAKIGLCAVLTLVFAMGYPMPSVYPAYGSLLGYVLICLRELLFGVAMGFVLTAMFSLTMTAGSIMDYQTGFSMASIYDPQNNSESPLSGTLFNIMLILSFFIMDGHLKLIDMLFRTIEVVPIGTAMTAPGIALVAIEVMSRSFVLSLMVAMPVLAAGMMMEVALGAVIKTVPQLNMFVVGIPLKIIVGLTVMVLALAAFAGCTREIFSETFDYIGAMFEYLNGAA